MTQRLITAFAALSERGTVAGPEAVWQRAVLAADVDDDGRLAGSGAIPLVAVTQPGVPDPSWVEVRAGEPFARGRGRARVGLAVGLSAAALAGAGISAVALRDSGDGGRDGVPGATGDPAATTTFAGVPDTSAPAEPGTETTFVEWSPTTFGGTVDTTAIAGTLPGYGFAIGQPCPSAGPAATSVPTVSTTVDDTQFPPTTPGGSMSGYAGLECVFAGGTLPPVADGPGSDWVASPTTLPADAGLVYWRMLEDLDITWRDEPDGAHVYWRTPAGQGSATDGFGGAAVLMVPAADRYIVLARTGTTATGAPGQRPLQVRAMLADGSITVAPLVYDNDLGLGHAYVEATQPIVQVAAE